MEAGAPAELGEPTSSDPLVAQMHRAVLADQPRRVRRVLARGCRPDAVNTAGQTPLFCAAFGARRAAVGELLRRGADPNARCDGGYTAVHGACYAGRLRVLRRLLECGGDLRLHDLAGRRPADWARLQPDPLRRRRVLQLIETARLAALTPSGRDMLVERSNSFSAGTGGVRTLLRRLMPRETPRRAAAAAADEVDLAELARSVQSVGFGAVYYGGGEAGPGALAVLPLATERSLEPDRGARGYPLGAYTEMAARLFLGTPVSVRRMVERPPPGAQKDLLIAELESARRLHHPSLLLLMAVCPSENLDAVTLVFERVPLGSLHHCQYTCGLRLAHTAAAELLLQVCAALQFMHAARWLHCAVTSHAVQLLTPAHAKLGCLEHALQVSSGPPRPQKRLLACRAEGALYNWLAPEVLRDGVPTEMADTYSFCALIWELIHGEVPWDGLSVDEISEQAAVGGCALAISPELCPVILRDVLELGLRADPQKRDLHLDEAKFMLTNLRDGVQRSRSKVSSAPVGQTPLARPVTPASRPMTPASRPATPASTGRRLKPPAPAPPRHVTPARLSRTLSPDALRPPVGREPPRQARTLDTSYSEHRTSVFTTGTSNAAAAATDDADTDPYTGLRRTATPRMHLRSATWQTRQPSPTSSWKEATAIKPASHRLTRHGSSCSLNRRQAACANGTAASPWPPAEWDGDTPPAGRRRIGSPRQHSVSLDGQSNSPVTGPRPAADRRRPDHLRPAPARSYGSAEARGADRGTRSLPRLAPLISDPRGVTRGRPGAAAAGPGPSAAGPWRRREMEVQASAAVTDTASQTTSGQRTARWPTESSSSNGPGRHSSSGTAPSSTSTSGNGAHVFTSNGSGSNGHTQTSTEPTQTSSTEPTQTSSTEPTQTSSGQMTNGTSGSVPNHSHHVGTSQATTQTVRSSTAQSTISSDEQMVSYSKQNFAARREFFSGRCGGGSTSHSQSDSALRLPQGVKLNPALMLVRDPPAPAAPSAGAPPMDTSSPTASRALLLGQPRPFQRPAGAATVTRVPYTSPGASRRAEETSGNPPEQNSDRDQPASSAATVSAVTSTPHKLAGAQPEPPAVSSLSSGTPNSGAAGHRLNVTFRAEVLEFSAPTPPDEPLPSPPESPCPAASDDERCYYDDDLASPDAPPPHLQLLEQDLPDPPPSPPLHPPPYAACLDDGGRASPLSMELPSSAAGSELDDLPALGLGADELDGMADLDDELTDPLTPLHVSESGESDDEPTLATVTGPGDRRGREGSPCITSSETTRSDGSRVRLFEVSCERGFETQVETCASQDGQCTVTCTNTNLNSGTTETYRQTVSADQVQTQIVVADR
ncbi:flocculation protein FLO11-like [Amphibalanus amphitrite]|uniref:flocculation protein FLO11-like n=1 Tax=Amphibalanus amphitrite TaxID=1232801 RepID=UPI001C907541|nr:flocculation protein FLO11-like [Amphibalanus amphitrite]XP_043202683.1 flocculation protein FLO11-like [Amphibalanus amphitrite]